MEELLISADEASQGMRIDKFISEHSEISRSFAQKLCTDGMVFVNGKAASKKEKVNQGDEVRVTVPEPEAPEAYPENIPIDVVYEDDSVIVVNKPQGMVVHPAAGNANGTLVNALLHHCAGRLSAINGVIRPGIVHRIDKDTSGLLVAAKSNEAHMALAAQLKERKALRKYVALVNGNIKQDEFTVNKPIGRSPSDRKKMTVLPGGREAVTHVRVLERFGSYTLVECRLETGRTHQIRVHMAYMKHSIVGDKAYGAKNESFNLQGQLLHAKTLGFVHPKTGELMTFDSELPEHFERVLKILRSKFV